MNLKSYADLGWSVIPVKGTAYSKDYDDSKKALVKWEVFQKRKPTPEEITEWTTRNPKASVGIITGPVNGFFVIDIDGNEWVKSLPNADFGVTWKTVSRRGCHYFYQWEDWMKDYPTTKSKVGGIEGFDIRGTGGYAIAPNGNESLRSWQVSFTEPLAVMPDWLRVFLKENLSVKYQKKTLIPFEQITEGNRHQSLLSYTGKLHQLGLKPPEIIQLLSPLAKSVGFESELTPLVEDVVTRYAVNRRETLRPESMEALLSETEPPLEWLIEGLWTDKSRGFIAGHPGIGKTWIALDMLLAVSTGGLCMGKYKAAYRAPCLLVEEEASRLNLQRRIHSMARAKMLQPSDIKDLYHITRQFASIPRDAEAITDIVREKGIKLIVFDSLRAVHSAKENSSDEMAVVLQSFSQIAEATQCSIVLIHHLAKSSTENGNKSVFERMRGTGSLWAWRDCILGIEGEDEADICKCSFQFRDAESPTPVQIKRHVGATSGAIGLQVFDTSESPEFMLKLQAAIAYLNTHFGAAFLTDIAKALEGRKQDNIRDVKLMLKKGLLVPVEGGKIGVPN